MSLNGFKIENYPLATHLDEKRHKYSLMAFHKAFRFEAVYSRHRRQHSPLCIVNEIFMDVFPSNQQKCTPLHVRCHVVDSTLPDSRLFNFYFIHQQ